MENPSTWGEAEKIVNDAYSQWCEDMERRLIGLSLARRITDALRDAGLLSPEVKSGPVPVRHA
jgi:hypothetical protein